MNEEIKIKAVVIFDIIGRPPEHIIQGLENVITEVGKEKGISIISKDIKEPHAVPNQENFYTTFAEVEVEADNILSLSILLLKYMPAHIEIISPEMMALSNSNWNDVLNEIIRRLHAYDEVARVVQIDKQHLVKKIEEITGKTIQEVMAQKTKTEEEKSENKQKTKQKKKPAEKKK